MAIKRASLCIVVLVLLAVLICIYLTRGTCIVPEDKDSNSNKKTDVQTVEESDFRLESRYISNNQWEYSINGQLPNPCYKAEVNSTVAESYPEQVTVTVSITPPNADEMCAQVIEEFSYDGAFSASDKAEVKLVVN